MEVRISFTWDVSDAVVGLDTAGGSPAEATGSLPAEHHGCWLCVAVGRQGGQQGQHSFLLPTSYPGNEMASLSQCQIWSKNTHTKTHTRADCAHLHIHTHTHACIHAHTHMHTHMNVCTHTHAHTHTHTHTHTKKTHTQKHTHTHTYMFSPIRLFSCCCSISQLTIMVGHKNKMSLLCPHYLIALI